jgi:hypothetical protein
MARLYADENFDYPVVEYLRQFGHDVLTVHALRACCARLLAIRLPT